MSQQTTGPVISTTRPARSKGAFATFGLRNNILRAVADAGFETPRPIQAKTIPQAMRGRDVLGVAQTGTGKTAAFALPIIERLVASRGRNPRALIMAPTRELAQQIHSEIQLLAKYTNVRSTTVFGGVGAGAQVSALRSRPDIIVACPGRLLDLMSTGAARLDGLEVLVLDEADHMLDMGFLPDIKRILARLPLPRQNLLFSATMPKEIRTLTDRLLRDPHVVEVAPSAPAETIEHALYPVEQTRKTALLRELLRGDDFRSAIVFLRTKHRARRLAQDLERDGHRAVALQGNMSQPQREKAMQGFRDGKFDVLVATDIAARGIDVANVSHVINFDVPNTPDAYTHRTGRTGRAERSGKAFTFVTPDDFAAIKAIERVLKLQIPRIKHGKFADGMEERADYGPKKGRGARAGGRPKQRGASRNKPGPKPSPKSWASIKPTASAAASSARADEPRAAFGAGVASRPADNDQKLSKRGRRRKRMGGVRTANESSGDAHGAGGKAVRASNHGSGRRTNESDGRSRGTRSGRR